MKQTGPQDDPWGTKATNFHTL